MFISFWLSLHLTGYLYISFMGYNDVRYSRKWHRNFTPPGCWGWGWGPHWISRGGEWDGVECPEDLRVWGHQSWRTEIAESLEISIDPVISTCLISCVVLDSCMTFQCFFFLLLQEQIVTPHAIPIPSAIPLPSATPLPPLWYIIHLCYWWQSI